MSMEGASKPERPRFNWKVERSGIHMVDIRLYKRESYASIGEFSFSVEQKKKLDPIIYGPYLDTAPSDFPPEYIEELRNRGTEYSKAALKGIETKPSTIANVGMWQINDEARGNLATSRQLFRVALQEFKKYNIEYIVGHYVAQRKEGLSIAPYVADMYKRLAFETGGEVYQDGNVWVSVAGLERWLSKES